MIDQLFTVAFALVLAAAIAFCLWSIRDMRAAHRISRDQIRELRRGFDGLKADTSEDLNVLDADMDNLYRALDQRIEALESHSRSLTEWADEAACVDEEYQQAASQGDAS